MPLMLTRVATVLSLNQDLEIDCSQCVSGGPILSPGKLSSPEKAVQEVQGSLLPLYRFPDSDSFASKRIRSFGDLESAVPDVLDPPAKMYSASDEDSASLDGSSDSAQVVPQRSVLDALILAEWEDREERGLFRYDVTACPTDVVPGPYGFIAQLNEGRLSKKRPTEFCIDRVVQPFDDKKFNFNKALQKEVLFQFEPKNGLAKFGKRGSRASFEAAAPPNDSPNLVLINVSPIEYGHILLVPRVLDCLPQLVTPDTMLLALQFAKEANNPYLRLGYNSLGAYGTINHLHFQAYYLAAPFAIERAPTEPIANDKGSTGFFGKRKEASTVSIQRLKEYPINALVFEVGQSLKQLARLVGSTCERLAAANIPHNLLIADGGARVFLWPNSFAERKAKGLIPEEFMVTQVDPACWEVAGHLVMKREEDYNNLTQDFAWRLLQCVGCSEEKFAEIVQLVPTSE